MRRRLILALLPLLAFSWIAAEVSARALAFEPPQDIVGIAISSDTPSGQWYYPSDPAVAISRVFHWLKKATPVFVRIPRSLVLLDYMGPAQLSLNDAQGSWYMVYPVHYLALSAPSSGPLVTRYPYPGDVVCVENQRVFYLRAPALYEWLRRDAWKRQFQPWEYTPAQQRAVRVVLRSRRGRPLAGLFPSAPGARPCRIPHGGPSADAAMEGTCATYARPKGSTTVVEFTETWNNGAGQHRWSFTVGKGGRIVRIAQSGDTAPQYWR